MRASSPSSADSSSSVVRRKNTSSRLTPAIRSSISPKPPFDHRPREILADVGAGRRSRWCRWPRPRPGPRRPSSTESTCGTARSAVDDGAARTAHGHLDRLGAPKLAHQVLGRVLGDHLAVIHDQHPRADHADLGQDVGAQDDRVILAEPLDQVADLGDLARIEADRRLVQDQHVRLAEQRLGQPDALAVPLGELADQLARAVLDVGRVHHPVDLLAALDARDALDLRHEVEIAADASSRCRAAPTLGR